MKQSLLIGIGILLCASTAFGQAGAIGLYVDAPAFTQCDYDDTSDALVPVYAVHKLCPGATASQWMVVEGGGFNCIYTGEVYPFPISIGSTRTGISLSYGGCINASNLLLITSNYFCTGISPACAYLEVVPDPDEPTGTIAIIDCNYIKLAAVGYKLYFNNDGTCGSCGLPTQVTNWGQIKAIYR